MMDGRVKTLHPNIHGGILARRAHAEDLDAAATHGIALVDLVCVNLYPFVATAARADVEFRRPRRADRYRWSEPGARGGEKFSRRTRGRVSRRTTRVCSRRSIARGARRQRFVSSSRGAPLRIPVPTIRRLPRHSETCGSKTTCSCERAASEALLPAQLAITGHKTAGSALRREPTSAGRLVRARSGARSRRRVDSAREGAVVYESARSRCRRPHRARVRRTSRVRDQAHQSVRRGNRRRRSSEAYVRARDADALAAFGGIVGLNRELDADTARAIVSTFIEAVIAPSVAASGNRHFAHQSQHAGGHGRLHDARRARRRISAMFALFSAAFWCSSATKSSRRGGVAVARSEGGHQAGADGRRVAGAAICLARDGARQVEHGDLCGCATHTAHRRRSDEPRGRGARLRR